MRIIPLPVDKKRLHTDQQTPNRHQLLSKRYMRWSPKTEQVGKRESSLGTAVWPEVRLVDYTEEAQCGVQGESGAGSDPGGRHGCRAVEPVWCACQPDPRLEEDVAGRHGVAVCAGQGCGR